MALFINVKFKASVQLFSQLEGLNGSPETATDETMFAQACAAPTVSAILAPRLPSGFDCPVVLSRTV